VAKAAQVQTQQIEVERSKFHTLIAQNPNYFGTDLKSTLKAVKAISGNTRYEQLTCIGFNPERDLLEAIVQVKLPFGYGGDSCGPGSQEYVRFFIDEGTGWADVGLTSFIVYDTPDGKDCSGTAIKPLSYAVSIKLDPKRDICKHPLMPKVRAVLSWGTPPSNDPNVPPVWGNALDGQIQIKKREWQWSDIIGDLAEQAKIKLEVPELFQAVQFDPIVLPQPQALTLEVLAKRYAPSKSKVTPVEPHRFAFAELQAATVQPVASDIKAKIAQWKDLGLDWSAAIGQLALTKGDTSYEQLDCLALDTNLERLIATFTIKRSKGYSSGLCDAGSQEYVTFYADWDNTCVWTPVGTVSVTVYDIDDIPADGLHYAAILPVDLFKHRPSEKECKIPKISRIRAVLSWNTPYVEGGPLVWGNELQTHVQIKRGVNKVHAHISALGGVGIDEINSTGLNPTGLTNPGAKFWKSPFSTVHGTLGCPFGGSIEVLGQPFVGKKYRITVRELGNLSSARVLSDPLVVRKWNSTFETKTAVNGFFEYLDPVTYPESFILYNWPTSKSVHGDIRWEVQLELSTDGITVDTKTPWYCLQLDNTVPDAEIKINGGDCKQFNGKMTTTITGTFIAKDDYFGSYNIDITPHSQSPNAVTSVHNILTGTGTWSLDTTSPNHMPPCAYVIALRVYDRSILNSSPSSGPNQSYRDTSFSLI
jgi:hypothetical protein